MSILIDVNQIAMSSIFSLSAAERKALDTISLRGYVLNSIRSYNVKFRDSHGEMILCYDSSNTWRRDLFAGYKHCRRVNAATGTDDVASFFPFLDQLLAEFREYLPYKVIKVDRCEGDDIIATLAIAMSENEPVMIVSSDHDFTQLQTTPNIQQYSHSKKAAVTTDNPRGDLFDNICRGEPKNGDGIPNILSPLNSFVVGLRQKPLTEKKLAEWRTRLHSSELPFTADEMRRFKENRELIDFRCIPQSIQSEIVATYNTTNKGNGRMIDYLSTCQLPLLTECASDFSNNRG